MPRKPNYRFDRMEKDRVKAAKKAERLKARQERSANRQATDEPDGAEAPAASEADDAGGATPGPRTGEA